MIAAAVRRSERKVVPTQAAAPRLSHSVTYIHGTVCLVPPCISQIPNQKHVQSIQFLTPHLMRVRLHCRSYRNFKQQPGQHRCIVQSSECCLRGKCSPDSVMHLHSLFAKGAKAETVSCVQHLPDHLVRRLSTIR